MALATPIGLFLGRLANFLETGQSIKKKVQGAMIYPVMVITFAMLIVSSLPGSTW